MPCLVSWPAVLVRELGGYKIPVRNEVLVPAAEKDGVADTCNPDDHVDSNLKPCSILNPEFWILTSSAQSH
jgi:hypothetical protein